MPGDAGLTCPHVSGSGQLDAAEDFAKVGDMAESPQIDPFGFFRNWVGEWEKLVNTHGADWLQKPEVAQAIQQMTAARMQAQAASDDAAAKVLGAANMPSKADVDALGERLGRIEAILARMEASQAGAASAAARPTPKRTRRPGT